LERREHYQESNWERFSIKVTKSIVPRFRDTYSKVFDTLTRFDTKSLFLLFFV
jgi:hypothetical protein